MGIGPGVGLGLGLGLNPKPCRLVAVSLLHCQPRSNRSTAVVSAAHGAVSGSRSVAAAA